MVGSVCRLLMNICLWNNILDVPVLEEIALDKLLRGKIIPHLHSIQANGHEAMIHTERVIASLYDVWTGPSVTGDRRLSLVTTIKDFSQGRCSFSGVILLTSPRLISMGKMLEKKHVSGGMETETGRLVRRLKKMLVELNKYDHARVLSRTFNLKEAL